jgi:hypothetical protein
MTFRLYLTVQPIHPCGTRGPIDASQYEENLQSAMQSRSMVTLGSLLDAKIIAKYPPLRDSTAVSARLVLAVIIHACLISCAVSPPLLCALLMQL